MSVKPITPAEAGKSKLSQIPDFVIEAVNNLLVKKYSKSIITILQKDIVAEIIKLSDPKMTSQQIFDAGYMDFEPIFRKSGWKVVYDRPAYCETYDANFTFSPK